MLAGLHEIKLPGMSWYFSEVFFELDNRLACQCQTIILLCLLCLVNINKLVDRCKFMSAVQKVAVSSLRRTHQHEYLLHLNAPLTRLLSLFLWNNPYILRFMLVFFKDTLKTSFWLFLFSEWRSHLNTGTTQIASIILYLLVTSVFQY